GDAAFGAAVCHAVRNVWLIHGRPRLLVRMIGERLGAASRAALSGAPTGMMTRLPVFDCFNRMRVPSYADHGNPKRSPCRWPVHSASLSGKCKCAGADLRTATSSPL